MTIKKMIIGLITLSASYVSASNNDLSYNNHEESVHAGNSFEMKMLATLTDLKNEIQRKFDAMDEKISDIQAMKHNINILKNQIPELDKYIDSKFDKLGKKQHDLEGNIHKKLENISIFLESHSFGNKHFEENYSRELAEINKNITSKLDSLDKKIQVDIKNNINLFDSMEENMRKIKDNITCKQDESSNTQLRNINYKLDEMLKNITELEQNINNKRIDAAQYNTELYKICQTNLECKEVVLHRESLLYKMDDKSLNHVTHRTDSNGDLTYFEMHLSIKTRGGAIIYLMSTPVLQDFNFVIWLSPILSSTYVNEVSEHKTTQRIKTPKLLSPRVFTHFYLKLTAGTLEFGKKGKPPILMHSDARFKTIKYFKLTSNGTLNTVTYLYDCHPFTSLDRGGAK